MKIRIRFKDKPEESALRALRRSVGANLYISETNGTRTRGEFRLGAHVTEILDDAKKMRRTVRYVPLDNVAAYTYSMIGKRMVLDGPPRRTVAGTAASSYRRIIQRSQDLLLPSLYGRLVRIPDVKLAMSPLRTILLVLSRRNAIQASMFVGHKKPATKVRNYFTLLRDLDIIRPEGDNYVAGPKMRKVSVEESEEELYSRILAFVLEQRFDYIREVLKWTMMVPFLEWSNAYYFPAYEAGTLLRWKDDDYFGYYHRLYSRSKSDIEILAQTTKVRDAEVVLQHGDFWVGDEEIFEEFSKQSDREHLLVAA